MVCHVHGMAYHGTPWYTMVYHGKPLRIPWYTMGYTMVYPAKFRTLQYGATSGQKSCQRSNTGPARSGRARSGPSRPIWVGKCQKQKVSELACLVGKSLVRPVGVLWTALEPPIGHVEQKSKNRTNDLIIIYISLLAPLRGPYRIVRNLAPTPLI